MQYTVRNVPHPVDTALRRKAKQESRSLNDIALEALELGAGTAEEPLRFHDLDSVAGTWREDPAFDRAIAAHDQVDADLWQ
ncbi:MAG TPA: hypothetical protein VMV72_09015 [Verrucomicrobiae bacterium]|nr:hypothetical protein [Verrucomicrobiae bacterium]